MTSTESEQITDEALASSISDDGRLSSEAFSGEEEGFVEAGIPPQSNDAANSSELDEEPFSVDDFDSDMTIEGNSIEEPVVSGFNEGSPEDSFTNQQSAPVEQPSQRVNQVEKLPDGQVAEFRKTLSALSRQLEIDRLTFLYQQLEANGSELPSLDRIASDIKGESALHPLGDQDLYSKRPLARLQGWISGLSFGVGRRAKKFSR